MRDEFESAKAQHAHRYEQGVAETNARYSKRGSRYGALVVFLVVLAMLWLILR